MVAASVAGLLVAGADWAPAAAQEVKLNPGYHNPLPEPAEDLAAVAQGVAAGQIETLPTWTQGFAIGNKQYSYTMVGTNPADGAATTVIPTVLIPFRLTIPDHKLNGHELVLDATQAMKDVIDSPIFTAAQWDSGNLQFEDGMLHAEFHPAPKGWHLTFAPAVAPTVDLVAPKGAVKVYQSKSGRYLGVIKNPAFFAQALNQILHNSSPSTYVVVVTYNSLFEQAFGFHSVHYNKSKSAATVYTYTSWLEGVDDLFTIPSPNADTLAHEISESTHDPLITSKTLLWGDWFRNNQCFQKLIEVGDAVEDAPTKVQNYREKVTINGKTKVFTLQSEALLPWFTRQYPSPAIHGAYSWPNENAILGPAPLKCNK